MAKILITGGAGNIGSYLAKTLVANQNHSVVVVDNLSTGSLNNIRIENKNFTFIKADANSFSSMLTIFLNFNFDFVFHFAAVVGVKRTLENPIKVLEDISNIKNILELAKNTGVKKVFYSSSSEVYGEPFEIPQNENTTPLNSRLPYAIVKNVGEAFCRSYYKEFGLNYIIFRFFNTYGPHQSEDFVIPRFVKAAMSNKTIYIHGDGLQSRTFCHIQDNVDTCIRIMENDAYSNEVYNVGDDREITILDLAREVILLCKSKSEIVHLPPLEEGDMKRRKPDNSKMKAILGKDLIPLKTGILELVAKYK